MNVNRNINYNLYLVTDRELLQGRELLPSIEMAIQGGVTMVQLREKQLSSLEFYNLAVKVKALTDQHHIPLIINDRLDIVLAVGAAGLHIGQDDLPAPVARWLLGPGKILGVSTATVEESLAAHRDGADYLGVGALFPTGTKTDARLVSLDTLAEIVKQVNIPVVAIGGIHAGNASLIRERGVAGIAVVSAILGAPDIRKAAKDLT